MMKAKVITLGCKVNQYESEAMLSSLLQHGFAAAEDKETADVVILNSCTVTAESDRKVRQIFRRAKKDNPDAVMVLTGCMAQAFPEDARRLEEADIILGTSNRKRLVPDLLAFLSARQRIIDIAPHTNDEKFEDLNVENFTGRTRAFVKIEDGCNRFCSYCIIPYARGAIRSLPLDTAVRQVRELRQQGYREVVVTGIEISSWGADLKNGQKPQDLIRAICEAVPDMRVRLGSLEPRTVDPGFCAALKNCENLCPQFHLSLQSGCDETLRRMNRHYTSEQYLEGVHILRRLHRKYSTERYLESCRLLRETFPDCAITTDLIVGFPQETEEEFTATLEFLRKADFAAMHIFPYSRRTGTPAADMPGQIPQAEKEQRAARAAEVEAELRQHYQGGFLGKCLPVLFEQQDGQGRWTGHTPNYILVAVESERDLHNKILPVKITGQEAHGLIGAIEA